MTHKDVVNAILQLGIEYAKKSCFEDVNIITFASCKTGKYCFVLQGGIEHDGRFEWDEEILAYAAALNYIKADRETQAALKWQERK